MKKVVFSAILACIGFNVSANENAKRIIEFLIEDDIEVFRANGKSGFMDAMPTVNAAQLIKEYGDNQYVYEKKYDKKLVNIKTVASGVKTSLTGDPYVVANGKNQFEYVSLELKNKDDAMNINKGTKLDMICLGSKNNVIFPSLKSCVTADSYFDKFLNSVMSDLDKLDINDKPSNKLEAVYLAMWEFDKQKPNTLEKFKTAEDFEKNQADFIEIMTIAQTKAKDGVKKFTLPKP